MRRSRTAWRLPSSVPADPGPGRAKAKLSQDKPAEDCDGVVRGLADPDDVHGDHRLAAVIALLVGHVDVLRPVAARHDRLGEAARWRRREGSVESGLPLHRKGAA